MFNLSHDQTNTKFFKLRILTGILSFLENATKFKRKLFAKSCFLVSGLCTSTVFLLIWKCVRRIHKRPRKKFQG